MLQGDTLKSKICYSALVTYWNLPLRESYLGKYFKIYAKKVYIKKNKKFKKKQKISRTTVSFVSKLKTLKIRHFASVA